MKNIDPKLSPWVQGPFELIRHADEHFLLSGDTDRRIALIGFDNAIEVCIDTFITLHPKLRKGVEIPKEEVEKAKRNYHTKIEYLETYVTEYKIPLTLPMRDILWYHQLRNELYHSGNGLVPERHVIEGARAAALLVFTALFDVDISFLLDKKSAANILDVATKPQKDSTAVGISLQQNSPVLVLRSTKIGERFALVAALPDGRYGCQILERDGNDLVWVTSFVKSSLTTLQGVKKYLKKAGYAVYTEPFPN